jgi:hypothetical protein
MQNKKTSSYAAIFRFLRDNRGVVIHEAMIDFELGLKRALIETFEDIKILGCWFHYAQALVRQLQKMPDSIRFRANVKEEISKLIALPLLPHEMIEGAYGIIKNDIVNAVHNNVALHFENFFKYFERFWLDKIGPHNFTVFGTLKRTNNSSEQFNQRLSVAMKTKHQNVWTFLGKIENAKFIIIY